MTYQQIDQPDDRCEERPRPPYGAKAKARSVPAELIGLSESPLVIHRCFIPIAGSIAGALFLSQALYWTCWSKNHKDPEGWFYKTQEEWTAKIGISRYELDQVRGVLKKKGILEEKLKGVPPKTNYHLNLEALAEAVNPGGAQQINLLTVDKLICEPSTNLSSTETTTETTSPPTPQGEGEEVAAPQAETEPEHEPPNAYVEELQRFAAYRVSMTSYFGRPETPQEWQAVEDTLRHWLKEGLPPLPADIFHRYCIEERDKLRKANRGMPRYPKALTERIANEAGKMLDL